MPRNRTHLIYFNVGLIFKNLNLFQQTIIGTYHPNTLLDCISLLIIKYVTRRSKAKNIFNKYIQVGAKLEIGCVSSGENEKYLELLDQAKDKPDVLSNDFYQPLQLRIIKVLTHLLTHLTSLTHSLTQEIYHNIFLPFKNTKDFARLTNIIKSKYNNVKLDDFEYFGKLGEGGFGLVVLGRKKSTKQYYALKLQTKTGLLNCFRDDPSRTDFEKQAFISCQHPFIVNLDYAFQNEFLAVMALEVATAGDLQKSLKKSPNGRLDEARVQFYAAEIVLALGHLHEMGLMYRDLKPNNVLLNGDGHVKLVDLGGVIDEKGDTLGAHHSESDKLVPLFARRLANEKPTYNIDNLEEYEHEAAPLTASGKPAPLKRQLSIMGTFGYMAPEMVVMLTQSSREKKGYTNAVDWWSLGITMYYLLVGSRPFTDDNLTQFFNMLSVRKINELINNIEYAMLFQKIDFPMWLEPETTDFIQRLLEIDPKYRLGFGPDGLKEIKSHPYFANIDWDLLVRKEIEPPFTPTPVLLPEVPAYDNHMAMLKELGKSEWLNDKIAPSDQLHFAQWDFLSPHTMRVEFGLANELKQYETKLKVRQLLGEKDGRRDSSSMKTVNQSTKAH
jgi:serine/threonine protein kinase